MSKNKITDTHRLNQLKKRFGPLLLLILLLLAIPLMTSALHTELSDDIKRTGVVTIRGEEVFRVNLNSQTPHQEVTFYPSKDQYTVIEVHGSRIRIKEDSTDSKFAVKKGWIQYPGETTVSLEHNLLLRIRSLESDLEYDTLQKRDPRFPF